MSSEQETTRAYSGPLPPVPPVAGSPVVSSQYPSATTAPNVYDPQSGYYGTVSPQPPQPYGAPYGYQYGYGPEPVDDPQSGFLDGQLSQVDPVEPNNIGRRAAVIGAVGVGVVSVVALSIYGISHGGEGRTKQLDSSKIIASDQSKADVSAAKASASAAASKSKADASASAAAASQSAAEASQSAAASASAAASESQASASESSASASATSASATHTTAPKTTAAPAATPTPPPSPKPAPAPAPAPAPSGDVVATINTAMSNDPNWVQNGQALLFNNGYGDGTNQGPDIIGRGENGSSITEVCDLVVNGVKVVIVRFANPNPSNRNEAYMLEAVGTPASHACPPGSPDNFAGD
jgi:hypothetical protein